MRAGTILVLPTCISSAPSMHPGTEQVLNTCLFGVALSTYMYVNSPRAGFEGTCLCISVDGAPESHLPKDRDLGRLHSPTHPSAVLRLAIPQCCLHLHVCVGFSVGL